MTRLASGLALGASLAGVAQETGIMRITVKLDRGRDVGQAFGSLFEASSADGALVVGAGFQNGYNTRYRADRHAVQFYIRPVGGDRNVESTSLPRPNDLCGTYLYGRDGDVVSTYGGVRSWAADEKTWQALPGIGGTNETMRVGNRVLEFGDSTVRLDGKVVLGPPPKGSYQLFFYANGHLCFYHVNRGDGGYRPYESDDAGFSKLYACPWTPGEGPVDLGKALVLTLPVVGETTFAWGQLGPQVVTGSNIGGFYVFENGSWRMLREPQLGVSYQLYSTLALHDRLLMGQYPTGRVFVYDGKTIADQPGWPPKLDGVSGSAREAQTTVVYGGDIFVGVWPWGELWRYNPDSRAWAFAGRMFEHPPLSDAITHPYDVENTGGAVSNQWGQRVTSLVTNGPDLFVSTSAKWPCEWDPKKFPFLAPDKWKAYGTVHRLSMPGHLGAVTAWTDGPTTMEFAVRGNAMSIAQDGRQIATATLTGALGEHLASLAELNDIDWGKGVYGPFAGTKISGTVARD
jgi:hypothetical protein